MSTNPQSAIINLVLLRYYYNCITILNQYFICIFSIVILNVKVLVLLLCFCHFSICIHFYIVLLAISPVLVFLSSKLTKLK